MWDGEVLKLCSGRFLALLGYGLTMKVMDESNQSLTSFATLAAKRIIDDEEANYKVGRLLCVWILPPCLTWSIA
jgi:hypothetical protein